MNHRKTERVGDCEISFTVFWNVEAERYEIIKMKKKYSLNAVSKPVEEKIEGDFMRVPDKKKSFKETIWSSDSKQFLGRTGESWGE